VPWLQAELLLSLLVCIFGFIISSLVFTLKDFGYWPTQHGVQGQR
jgi:hypothetical protein